MSEEVATLMGATLLELDVVSLYDPDVNADNSAYSQFKCNDTDFLNDYSTFLAASFAADPSSASTALTCNDALSDKVLKVAQCKGKPALCIDCTDPCSSENDYCSESFLAPCQTHVNCPSDVNYLKMYTTKYQLNSIFTMPVLMSSSYTATSSTLTVTLEYDDDGFTSCGVFESEISDLAPLMVTGVEKETDSGSVSYVFTGLTGSSEYFFYCREKTLDGREASLGQVLDTLETLETAC